jgi:hypothetical protein
LDRRERTYETTFTDKTPELAALVYRVPFPQNKLELIRGWIRGIISTPIEDGVDAQVVRYEV